MLPLSLILPSGMPAGMTMPRPGRLLNNPISLLNEELIATASDREGGRATLLPPCWQEYEKGGMGVTSSWIHMYFLIYIYT